MASPSRPKHSSNTDDSERFLRIAETVWKLTILSLPIDFFIRSSLEAPCVSQPELGQGSLLCLAVAVLGVASEPILRRIEQSRRSNDGAIIPGLSSVRSVLPTLLVFLAAVKFAAPLLAFWKTPVIFLPLAVVAAVLVVRHHKSKTKTARIEPDARPPLVRVRQWEIEAVFLCMIPMLAARAFSVQQSMICAVSELNRFTVIALIFFLLMALRPKRNFFIARCRRCFKSCSRALVNQFPNCPSCNPKSFTLDRGDHVSTKAGR